MNEWRDISSAPTDGTPILVWGPTGTGDWSAHWPRSCWWSEHGHQCWVLSEDDNGATFIDEKTLTHWMPLPVPPSRRLEKTDDIPPQQSIDQDAVATGEGARWQRLSRLVQCLL